MGKVNSKWKIPNCEKQLEIPKMPQPCAAESHVYCYKNSFSPSLRCHGLCRGVSRLLLTSTTDRLKKATREYPAGCQGPSAASVRLHGARPWHLKNFHLFVVAANVRLHPARGWHLLSEGGLFSSSKRETPPPREWHQLRKVAKGFLSPNTTIHLQMIQFYYFRLTRPVVVVLLIRAAI